MQAAGDVLMPNRAVNQSNLPVADSNHDPTSLYVVPVPSGRGDSEELSRLFSQVFFGALRIL
jgi:hypothetical protein